MVAPKISNDEVIEYLKKGLSPVEISRIKGMAESGSFNSRIRRIAEQAGISYGNLRQKKPAHGVEHNFLHTVKADRRVHKLKIQDGIILVGTDPHYSRIDRISASHRAFCQLLTHPDIKQDLKAVILNGDIGDFGSVSRFPRGPWRNEKAPDIREELEAIQERLGEIESNCSKKTTLLRTLGNHDDRFEARLSFAAPQYEGMAGTRLKDHIPRWDECERIDVNEDCEFVHNIRNGTVGRDRANVLATGHSTVVGHSHQLHIFPQTWRRGTYYGVCAGTLADLDDDVFAYTGSRPKEWQSGFVVMTWYNGKLLYPEVGYNHDGKVYFRGKEVK
jgi:hypothetical protein